MEIRVEGRRPGGRPRKTLVDNMGAVMAELAISTGSVHKSR